MPEMTAIISPCGRYRYMLQRGDPLNSVGFVMLNPSTADGEADDPTIRKCMGFARDWGYGGITVVNVFAFRATSPADMLAQGLDADGPDNPAYLLAAASLPLIVVAWGNHVAKDTATDVETILTVNGAQLWCLKRNANGSPKHPLYVPYDTKLTPWTSTQ